MAAETYIYDGSNWRKSTEVHKRGSGVTRDCKEVHIFDGSVWRKVFEKVVVSLLGETVSATNSGATAYGGIRFNSGGTIDKRENATYTQVDAVTDWIQPNSAAADDTYEIYVTYTGDTLNVNGGLNSWIDIDTNPEYTVRDLIDDGSDQSGILLVDLRKNGGAATINNATYPISAERTP